MRKRNPSIYEINTRVWIKKFAPNGLNIKIDEVPEIYWRKLSKKGIDYIWLMGIWETVPTSIKKYCLEEDLIREYKKALKNFSKEDVIGSPYAINKYEVNPLLGNFENLANLRKILQKYNLKLILDFIPNHFHAESELTKSNPEIFLRANEHYYNRDTYTFFKAEGNERNIFAHGRDPFFPAWQDTVQVNYFNPKAKEFMINSLLELSDYCDGFRCDMAMLSLNNIFKNTWGGVLENMGYQKPEKEFWEEAITKVKNKNSGTIFIAEAYWDLEWNLQQLGFDFTYDKILTERLQSQNVAAIRDHLKAEYDYQKKSLRFIENHDEQRASKIMGKELSLASAIVISTIQGMRFYNDGQFEGKKISLPVQLGKEPMEHPDSSYINFYNKLLRIVRHEIFKSGKWKLIEVESSFDEDNSYKNFLAWEWTLNEKRRLIIINFSHSRSRGRVRLNVSGYPSVIHFFDLFNDQLYTRTAEEVHHKGLYVDLQPFNCHILSY